MTTRDPKGTETVDDTRVETRLADELFPDLYGNVVKANITPFELNLIFGRAAVPVNAPDNVEVKLIDNISTVVRIAVPITTLPSIIRLLELQLQTAREKGLLPAETPKEPKEAEQK